jgi:hypothetical protein
MRWIWGLTLLYGFKKMSELGFMGLKDKQDYLQRGLWDGVDKQDDCMIAFDFLSCKSYNPVNPDSDNIATVNLEQQ